MAKKVKKQKRTGRKNGSLIGWQCSAGSKGMHGGWSSVQIAAVLIFAYLLKSMSLSDGVIAPVNEGIKMIAVTACSLFGNKKAGGPAWLIGALSGVVYMALGFFVFSLLDGGMGMWQILLSDLLTGLLVGLIGGITFQTLLSKPKQH